MFKRLLLGLLLLFSTSSFAAGNINEIVFFGDSLTDNGKLYQILLHIIPKSPPYYNGRFSNGPTWAEHVAKYYYDKYYLNSNNYALGGATAVFHFPNSKFMSTTTLDIEVNAYLLESIFKKKNHVLFVIWIGANDYLYTTDDDYNADTSEVVNKIDWAMRKLQEYGANNFLIINLPDLSRIPFAKENNVVNRLSTMTTLHNIKLNAIVESFQEEFPHANIYTIDAFTRLNNLLDNPDFYNKKYNINITDTTTSCWLGGFTLRRAKTQATAKDIEQEYMRINGSLPADFDAQAMSDYIMNSPELAYTYAQGKSYESGNYPCSNANEHVFWDAIHPTAVVHQIFATIIEETLGEAV